MAKDWAKGFYKSKAWKKCRESYITSVLGMCEQCGDVGYIVHHKVHITKDNINNQEITLSHKNLEYLCLDCHNRHHNFGREKQKSIREGFKFDENGEFIIDVSPPIK